MPYHALARAIDAASSGFEHPVLLADLDGDGALEIYVASEDQQELRQYRWKNGAFEKSVVMPLHKGDKIMNTCTYSAAGQGKKFGDSSTDEMCFAISYVVPAIATTLDTTFCVN